MRVYVCVCVYFYSSMVCDVSNIITKTRRSIYLFIFKFFFVESKRFLLFITIPYSLNNVVIMFLFLLTLRFCFFSSMKFLMKWLLTKQKIIVHCIRKSISIYLFAFVDSMEHLPHVYVCNTMVIQP